MAVPHPPVTPGLGHLKQPIYTYTRVRSLWCRFVLCNLIKVVGFDFLMYVSAYLVERDSLDWDVPFHLPVPLITDRSLSLSTQ